MKQERKLERDKMERHPMIQVLSADGNKEIGLQSILLNNRNIFLFGEINDEALYSFTLQLFSLVDSDDKINIFINSPGGDVLSGLAIYDLIRQYRNQIDLYCIGIAASMGAIILSAGSEGRRFILPHSKVMIHEPLLAGNLAQKSASSIQATAESILETKGLLVDILSENTKNTREFVEQAISHDNFMTAEEAIDFKIVDKIVEEIRVYE